LPLELSTRDGFAGKPLVYSTTNGTVALRSSRGARVIYAASLRNVAATLADLGVQHRGAPVVIVCAGSAGALNLEDFYAAGCFVERLSLTLDPARDFSDTALAARAAVSRERRLDGALRRAHRTHRLRRRQQRRGAARGGDRCVDARCNSRRRSRGQDFVMVILDPTTDLSTWVGREVAVSPWLTITQQQIDAFAEVTIDPQWIHVDPERAARESPFGTTIAHGFLTLSLLSHLYQSCIELSPRRLGINVGFNRVRFTSPVKVDSRIRGRFALQKLEPIAGGFQFTWNATIDVEGDTKPACVTEWVTRVLV
jgi:acyl dehydratase